MNLISVWETNKFIQLIQRPWLDDSSYHKLYRSYIILLYHITGVDLEPDSLGVSRTPKLENLGVRQQIWESAIFLKYDVTMMAVIYQLQAALGMPSSLTVTA